MCNYIVTNKEIEKAEKDIFENGLHFNDKQKVFLKCLDSCCMQAYAGTGKTSAIVGKLHVLAQKDVWKNGRGICVISHTNVAVDEIKKHVAKHYPAIMQYPNFIGTIQEFTNKFLFIPYLASKGLKIRYQDESRYFDYNNEIQDQTVVQRINNKLSQLSFSKNSNAKKDFFEKMKTVHLVEGKLYARAVNSQFAEYTDFKTKEVSQGTIVEALSTLIQKKHNEGYFLFVESFICGYEYLNQNPILKDIIRQRFQYVFLDEAQDCSAIQLKILNELFDDSSKIVFQQIGDINQAISAMEWVPDKNYLTLIQSTRFGDNLAVFINKFQVGNGSGVSGTAEETKKYLITYDSGKEKDVLPKYAEILKSESVSAEKGYFAISHRHEHLEKYFLEYSENLAKNKSKKTSYRFDSDIEYIDLLTKEVVLQRGSNLVWRVLYSLLYKQFKMGDNSWSKLREFLRIGEKADDFNKIVIEICNDILQNGGISDLDSLKNRLNAILGEDRISFANCGSSSPIPIQNQAIENKYSYNGVEINVGTIHSVKGQTHGATLLFSNKEDKKQDIQHTMDNTKKRTPEFKRRFYVASSRARHLFAFAIEKTAYNDLTDKLIFQDFTQEVI
ncbi:MAG: UvrD-helicase domain-containing protein [Candidatus Omnitrophica bacterium]|nr:UvrD-helicase domain-containing protein [Candidatus Omnitrophota bacterium]